jgi:16S rRNA (guanine966-N2)-methyltransferase
MRSPAARVLRGAKARMLRIIGGTWRGRTWRFPDGEIRPTPDLEALSRGAGRVVFVEKSAATAQELRQTLALWGGERAAAAQVQRADAKRFLMGPVELFDVAFLDPPFAAGLLGEAAARLEQGGWLAPNAAVYAECPARDALPPLPASWRVAKSGRAGEVGYHLLRRTP